MTSTDASLNKVAEHDTPVISKFTKPKFNLSAIRYGIDAEIDEGLKLFCADESWLSKIYWPRAFRELVKKVLVALRDKPSFWKELSTDTVDVTVEFLGNLIEELQLSTSKYIKVKHRKWIAHLLRETSLFRKKYGLSARLPSVQCEDMEWPNDLEDKRDLSDSLTTGSLRKDVSHYIWKILDEVIPTGKYCQLNYNGGMVLKGTDLPIIIEVTEDMLETCTDRFTTVSSNLRRSNLDNLLPIDVIKIEGVPPRDPISVIEEVFIHPDLHTRKVLLGE